MIVKRVLEKIAMSSAKSAEAKRQREYKRKNFETLRDAIQAGTPKNDMHTVLNKKIEAKLLKYDNIITLAELRKQIFSKECEVFSLAMKGLKMSGLEAVASIQDKKISFLSEGRFISTYKFLTPNLLKKI